MAGQLKALGLVAALLAAGLWTGGCGAVSGTATGQGAGGKTVEPIVFWHSMAGDLGKAMRTIIDKFNALHPATPIEAVYQGGYDLLQQKIRTSVVAGQPPVMAQMYEAWTAYLNRDRGQEALLPLDGFVTDADFKKE
ncbi:MAG: extracellular solute-binding protein, partial [Candidatus Wallbacteria bacterium]|nr:extracellular solute-binding protein [Candidatus Wallbacteria bacterium]